MDIIFKALADSSRRELIIRLHMQNGQTLRALSADLSMTRQAVTKHLGILEAAGIVTTDWRGREKLHYLNSAPLMEVATGWFNNFTHTAALPRAATPPRPEPSPAKPAPPEPAPTEIDGESRWTNL